MYIPWEALEERWADKQGQQEWPMLWQDTQCIWAPVEVVVHAHVTPGCPPTTRRNACDEETEEGEVGANLDRHVRDRVKNQAISFGKP